MKRRLLIGLAAVAPHNAYMFKLTQPASWRPSATTRALEWNLFLLAAAASRSRFKSCNRPEAAPVSTGRNELVYLGRAALVILALYLRAKRRDHHIEMLHRERLAAIEKGVPLPEFPRSPLARPTSGIN